MNTEKCGTCNTVHRDEYDDKECIQHLHAQLAAEREKSAGLEREYLVERNLLQGAEAALSAALAAQKAAEKRAERMVKALRAVVEAGHENGNICNVELAYERECDCVVAIVEAALAPQAPAASPSPVNQWALCRHDVLASRCEVCSPEGSGK